MQQNGRAVQGKPCGSKNSIVVNAVAHPTSAVGVHRNSSQTTWPHSGFGGGEWGGVVSMGKAQLPAVWDVSLS